MQFDTVLPLANSPGGHRLGVNGLAVDSNQSILYSGGRDGVICSWDLDLDLHNPPARLLETGITPIHKKRQTTFRSQAQAHTHWINDIILCQNNTALVSASSDLTVKLWRPLAGNSGEPATIGLHSDYVKCLATPRSPSNWVASGGLDHKMCLWDLNGGGKTLEIDVGREESSIKGSIYALSATPSILASGGPESIVRIWDTKSGKRVTKFVGHTDNVRAILITETGDTIMTASSDQTVKVWSVTAGRCMYTLTMHNDSVWSLYSDHPQLAIFYSSDRSGLVAKTDIRGTSELDNGLCVAVCQEPEGVSQVAVSGDYLWTATSSSSINRWADVDTGIGVQGTILRQHHRSLSASSRPSISSPPNHISLVLAGKGNNENVIPLTSILRISNTSSFLPPSNRDAEGTSPYSLPGSRRPSEAITEEDIAPIVPLRTTPEESIEGQNGLIKHIMLNDRRRVLTSDTTGEVVMWDLLKCVPIQSFGKRHLEDVVPEVNTMESIANWCAVDTRTGELACVLEENYCFDAELYADEIKFESEMEFKEDQRINLGKWVLRYLFSNLIDEEIRRDETYRMVLNEFADPQISLSKGTGPTPIQIPPLTPVLAAGQDSTDSKAGLTPRGPNSASQPLATPGLSIGLATPAISFSGMTLHTDHSAPTNPDDVSETGKRVSTYSQARASTDKAYDYFSSPPTVIPSEEPVKLDENQGNITTTSAPEPEKESSGKEGNSLFGKKFRMSFGSKRLGKSSSAEADKKASITDEKSEDSDGSKSAESKEKTIDDNFYGCIQKIRHYYDMQLSSKSNTPIKSNILPSPPSETPPLNPPPHTAVIIQEDRPDSGGVADLYRGTVATLGTDADLIEKKAPMWLGELLLRNQVPVKDTNKVSFVLLPYQDLLPSIASAIDGNSRLNANRNLRVKKILAYVAERIEAQSHPPDPTALKPEDYLEIYCQNKLVSQNMTLATLRAHVWKTGGDIMLYYKSNGLKKIVGEKTLAPAEKADETALAILLTK
ncbi:MAG: hypothetical protein M1829_004570 [Trizodia sp. TS-e1964]|nr:MAG: hypothetical protein M1829_004570 [Trizodia sp. TS-e1964]